MFPVKSVFIAFFTFIALIVGCKSQQEIKVPEYIADQKLTKLISGKDAIKSINKLHGLEVAPEENAIAEYGEDPKDLLYISKYNSEEKAREAFQLMMRKMTESVEGPFSHIMALPDYDESVYISIGMGAIHYIFQSEQYILWLQTNQEIGRELPENLIQLYPVE
jgi:hypothetical protein